MPLHFRVTEAVRAPADAVYAALTGPEAFQGWLPGLLHVEAAGDAPFGVGTTYVLTREQKGERVREEFEVTALDPPRCVEWHVDGMRGSAREGRFRLRYELQPGGADETNVILDGELSGLDRWTELFARTLGPVIEEALASDLRALKSHLESGSGSGALPGD